MKVVVAGGTGFIGEPLVQTLLGKGEVVVLTRDPSRVKAGRPVSWQPKESGPWSRELADADVVINLAGENIAGGRWSEERKRALIDSRLDATKALVSAMREAPRQGRTFVSASAIGYYGDRGEEVVDESSSAGKGFLADLVDRWEAAAREAAPIARLVILRFGIVLAADGGALAKMVPPFKLGAGGPIGSGQQWMSWIDRGDVLKMIGWVIDRAEAQGIYNATAPEPVRNRQFTSELGKALHRPAVIPAPAFAIRLLFGEMGEETILTGQRVSPAKAMAEGFSFGSPSLPEALQRIF
jgi:uncharacterized protein (TIGR01777 family)